MKRMVGIAALLVLFMISALGYYAYSPLPLQDPPLEFSLKQGANLKGVAHQLQQAHLLEHESLFVWLGRLLGKAGQLKSGEYVIAKPMSPMELLNMLVTGQVAQSQLSVIEGWTFRQFREALNQNPHIAHRTAAMSDAQILQLIGATEKHPEGLFFPDTYYFASGSSDVLIFKRAYQTMQKRLQQAWDARAPGLPLQTPYQALILASIVEKETGAPSDRDMIAAVFVNRLRKQMLLQTDPTVIYGIGPKFDGNLRKRDLLRDTPYNTYTRAGLTPTPISLPGAAALHSALHPAQDGALYFVSRGDGSSYFSKSLIEHNRAVNRYQIKSHKQKTDKSHG